jgi:hypothetical protein
MVIINVYAGKNQALSLRCVLTSQSGRPQALDQLPGCTFVVLQVSDNFFVHVVILHSLLQLMKSIPGAYIFDSIQPRGPVRLEMFTNSLVSGVGFSKVRTPDDREENQIKMAQLLQIFKMIKSCDLGCGVFVPLRVSATVRQTMLRNKITNQ